MIKVGEFCYSQRLIPYTYSEFSNWNLDLLDLQNLEDEECLEALNENIFKPYYRKYDSLHFSSIMNQLEQRHAYYG